MADIISISSHPKWKIPKDTHLTTVRNMEKLKHIRSVLCDELYQEFLEACIDEEVFNEADVDIQFFVDQFYGEDHQDDPDGGERKVA